MRLFSSSSVCALLLWGALSPAAWAQDLASFEKAVTEFTLDNGMHFIVLERHNAPVVSFNTYANVGSADDPSGLTGLAHMFEHMAFKGTAKIGSKDYDKEQPALDAVDQTYSALQAERRKGPRADESRLTELQQ
jgi:predicted Zn-dependent peptidase